MNKDIWDTASDDLQLFDHQNDSSDQWVDSLVHLFYLVSENTTHDWGKKVLHCLIVIFINNESLRKFSAFSLYLCTFNTYLSANIRYINISTGVGLFSSTWVHFSRQCLILLGSDYCVPHDFIYRFKSIQKDINTRWDKGPVGHPKPFTSHSSELYTDSSKDIYTPLNYSKCITDGHPGLIW